MEKQVSDVMQKTVVQVSADAPLISVARLFADEQISGAPVMSDTGTVVGVISLSDIVRSAGEEAPFAGGEAAFYRQIQVARPAWMEDLGEMTGHLDDLRAADVMTQEVVSVRPDATIPQLAKLVRENHIHRVLVTEPTEDGENLLGLVSLFDLVRLLE